MASIFILLWAVAAIAMGLFFAVRPAAMEGLATRLGQRRRYSERQLRLQVHINRIGGMLFVALGVTFIVLVLLGMLPPGD